MTTDHESSQQTTAAVLGCVEKIFGADWQSAEETFYVADRENTTISYVSSSYERVWGRSRESLVADPLNWMKSIHEDDIERVREATAQRPDSGSMDVEYRIVRPDGEVRFIHDRSILQGADGGSFVVGRCRDITSMRDTESQLQVRKSQQEYLARVGRTALSSAQYSDALSEMTRVMISTLQADAVEILNLLGPRQLVIESFAGTVEPTDTGEIDLDDPWVAHMVYADDRVIIAADSPMFSPRLRKQGFVDSVGVPIRNEDGELQGLIGVYYRNLHVRDDREIDFVRAIVNLVIYTFVYEKQQRLLKMRESMFRELAEHIDDAFWIRDVTRNRLQYVSPAFELIWGRPRDVLFEDARAWYDGVVETRDGEVVDLLTGEPCSTNVTRTYRIRRPDGSMRWVRERAFPIFDDKKRIRSVVGLAQDITEAHEAEEARVKLTLARAAQHSAEAQVSARDEVLALVSHDLRNPLTTVGVIAKRLNKPLTDEKRAASAATLMRAVERMTRLLDDLLVLSRMEAGEFHLDQSPTTLEAVFVETLAAFADWPGIEDVTLRSHIEPGTPAAISADHFRLVQALTNLVGNAMKFTPKGGSIEVGAQVRDGMVELSVADTGVGIAQENIERLFDRFWQANRTDRRGTGLGLSIVKGIVQAHGGKIWAESTLNVGTRFTLSLPLAPLT